MIIKFFIAILIYSANTFAQTTNNNCQGTQPPNLQNLLPTQCCDIRFIFDDQTVKKCMNNHQGLSNVNVGVKGRFDGLECLFSCLFNATNTFSNGVVNVPALKAYASQTLTRANQTRWITIVNEAIDACNSKTSSDQEKIKKSLNGKPVDGKNICNPVNLYFGSCIYFYQIRKCPFPAPNIPQKLAQNCTDMKNYFTTCPVPPLYLF
ncbi:hypothetical protein PVAND_007690 [Polypedilum vanderplanki]|uniref:OBP47-like domain-containing protein n=1 Tax=Polypedilum vanderplanki TaxID=319348 RepID=A0A9J6C7F4_POLVA|nr:hypothetical protein PVAND_007690 [Polypedilum vanderplanki]